MQDWMAFILIMGVGYALVLLTRISSQLGGVEERLDALLAHEGVKGQDLDTDTDPD